MLTRKQLRLVEMIERRNRHAMPTVQRDLAEFMGIRGDSLNKLLRRTRRALEESGQTLTMPPRGRVTSAARCTSLAARS